MVSKPTGFGFSTKSVAIVISIVIVRWLDRLSQPKQMGMRMRVRMKMKMKMRAIAFYSLLSFELVWLGPILNLHSIVC